jgi:hypothetical protein
MFEWLPGVLREASSLAASLHIEWVSSFAEPATKDDLLACEDAVSEPLSPSHRAFLQTYNGASLALKLPDAPGGVPWATYGVQIFSTREIILETAEVAELFDAEVRGRNRFLTIARYGREGDRCLADYNRVQGGEAAIVDAFHEVPDDWSSSPIIAQSFEDWLRRLLDGFVSRQEIFWYWMPGDLTVEATIAELST